MTLASSSRVIMFHFKFFLILYSFGNYVNMYICLPISKIILQKNGNKLSVMEEARKRKTKFKHAGWWCGPNLKSPPMHPSLGEALWQ